MASDFYGFEDDEPRPSGGNLFLWTVFILLLIGAAFACWLGSFYVFGHPEQPRSYAILRKLKKLDDFARVEVTQAPPGEFLTPQKLFDKYSKYERLQLQNENAELMRNFIKNYHETKKLVPYVTGKFEIVDTVELKPTDAFPTGLAVLTVAQDFSQVLVEQIFTSAPETVPVMKRSLPRGLDMPLERTHDLAAVIHIERTSDGHMLFTTMPLLYGTLGVRGSVGSFSLEPPASINLKAGVPVFRGDAFSSAMTAFGDFRRTKPVVSTEGETAPATNEPALVRVDNVKPGATVATTGTLPELPVATPIPAATPMGTPRKGGIAVRGSPRLIAGASPAASPPGTPYAMLRGTPAPLALATPPPPVPVLSTPAPMPPPAGNLPPGTFKPFVQSTTEPTGGGNWATFPAGKQPAGQPVTCNEVKASADRGVEPGPRTYLTGDFKVTASGESKAVLRETEGKGGVPVRIIVTYPNSILPPAEGTTLTRNFSSGFEITGVRKGADGQLNIYVREIIATQ